MRQSINKFEVHDNLDSTLLAYLDFCRCKNLSPHTIGYYSDRLNAFFNFCRHQHGTKQPTDISPTIIRAYISQSLDEGYSPKTINHALIAIKGYFSFLIAEDEISVSPVIRIRPLKLERKIIQTFSDDDIARMLNKCDLKTFVGLRNYTMILTLLDTGIRVSELCNLRIADIDWDNGLLKILGKGKKERLVPFGRSLYKVLSDYLRRRGDIESISEVFLTHFSGRLDRRVVVAIFNKLGLVSGISGVRVSPHTFRHTFAKNWILNGGDPFSLQRILGHTTQQMVSQYVNLATGDLQLQHSRFSPVDRLILETRTQKKKVVLK